MTAIVEIPLNTMLADLDAALRRLLKAELARHGFGAANVVFEAPTREWAATLSAPTVSLFLYDLCEATGQRTVEWRPQRVDGALRELRPPLQLEASYAVTAFTQGVEDEHRLLSQVIGILYAHPSLPVDVLSGTLLEVCGDDPPETAVAQARPERRIEFWSAIGGQYKPSVDFSVIVPFPSGRSVERGAPVQTRLLRSQVQGGEVEQHDRVVAGRQAELSEVHPGR